MSKSTDTSQEKLKTADSSPSVLPGASEEENDQGIYDVPYRDGYWVYIEENEEVQHLNQGSTTTGWYQD